MGVSISVSTLFGGHDLLRGAVCIAVLLWPPAFSHRGVFPLGMDAVSRFGGVRALGLSAAVVYRRQR